MCIGYKFAWAEMRLIVARLLYSFDMSFEGTPSVSEFGQQQTFVFWQKDPLLVRLKHS